MRIKHWIYTLAVTLLLSSGLWAQSYSAPRFDGAKVVNASYRRDNFREHRHHHRHHHHRHHR